jgi:hypothetical protein
MIIQKQTKRCSAANPNRVGQATEPGPYSDSRSRAFVDKVRTDLRPGESRFQEHWSDACLGISTLAIALPSPF